MRPGRFTAGALLLAAHAAIGCARAPAAAAEDAAAVAGGAERAVFAVHTEYGTTSGFLADARGIVMTDVRILRDAKRLRVQLDNSTKVEARLLARYDRLGVAVFRINPATCVGLPALSLAPADARPIESAARVIILAGPFGAEPAYVLGKVTGADSGALELDVPVPWTLSGGPVLDSHGALLGMALSTRAGRDGRPRPARAIPAAALRQPLADAQKLLATASPPTARRLAVVPRVPFPPKLLESATFDPKQDLGPYLLADLNAAGRYRGLVYTPPLLHRLQMRAEAEAAKHEKDGAAKPAWAAVSHDPFEGSGVADWARRTYAPVVVLELTPQLRVKPTGPMSLVLPSPEDLEFAVDLVNFDLRVDGKRVEDLTRGIAWLSLEQLSQGVYDDVGAVGVAAYDPQIFLPRDGAWPTVDVIIESTDKPGIWRSSQISQRTLEQVALDFEPWCLQQRARRWAQVGPADPAAEGTVRATRVAAFDAGSVCELARGMSAAQLQQRLGAPARVFPLRAGADTERPWDAVIYEYLAGRDPLYRSHTRQLANRLVFAAGDPDTVLMLWELEAPAP